MAEATVNQPPRPDIGPRKHVCITVFTDTLGGTAEAMRSAIKERIIKGLDAGFKARADIWQSAVVDGGLQGRVRVEDNVLSSQYGGLEHERDLVVEVNPKDEGEVRALQEQFERAIRKWEDAGGPPYTSPDELRKYL